ncbi:hypothetical protein BpHYR1_019690 [Brachionus plicatilis]|uniref:Uncharacterized protein n=1 Tax=Brachionus plicatilis TaxID=10195 RepID=A0A3M7PNH5_BRAPC|nr:hypothetical protein BpHYR1_019690 [Brachionus plicatilis]
MPLWHTGCGLAYYERVQGPDDPRFVSAVVATFFMRRISKVLQSSRTCMVQQRVDKMNRKELTILYRLIKTFVENKQYETSFICILFYFIFNIAETGHKFHVHLINLILVFKPQVLSQVNSISLIAFIGNEHDLNRNRKF